MSKNRRKTVSSNRYGMYAIAVIAIVLFTILLVQSQSLKAKNAEYEARKAELEQEIQDEEVRAQEIADLSEYLNSDEYVEQLAREKLGLVYEDEIVYRVAEE